MLSALIMHNVKTDVLFRFDNIGENRTKADNLQAFLHAVFLVDYSSCCSQVDNETQFDVTLPKNECT